MKPVVMNMSGVYKGQTFYRSHPYIWIDAEDIPGTNCYCDETAKSELRRRLKRAGAFEETVHWLDSGNYHYLSLLYMERIRQDFALVLFDNHPDMQRPAFGNVTSCGGWVYEALQTMPHLKAVYMYGVEADLIRECGPLDPRVHLMRCWGPEETIDDGIKRSAKELSAEEEPAKGILTKETSAKDVPRVSGSLGLYISIDKDVLSPGVSCCNWSQGIMTEEQLQEELRPLLTRQVLGVDLCGETSELYDSQEQEVNDALNASLGEFLDTFL